MKLDLEVSEPIDFGSGDHQHLIRKAADKSIQSESGERYTPSSSAGPQETREKPRPKGTEQLDTYVVEISDDITPGDSNATLGNPFSDASVRRAFIIKVFLLLSAQLLLTAVITSVFIFWEALKVWVLKNPWFIYATFPAFFVVLIILACCGNLRRQVPANYILLGFFWDFTLLNGVLFVFCFVLLIYGIILIFVRSYWLHLLYAGLGTVLFSFYLVMDVQLMLGGHHHYSLDPEEYVFAALNIYLDIINLFIFILRLIGLGR
ncbi:PREDICTED: protein lifeguard 1 isoform X3 [Cercocebus atys]|uniref:protein lifeguard 1 isoform X3 n=1 Tax=Cercocebus atys TaxID=9531 RepID=UPI0005F56CD4|nr:PREDICTED: protein lifeguard 1 isoform X3 [Cercocebus atys]